MANNLCRSIVITLGAKLLVVFMFRRYLSWYLPKKWSKEPYDVGYPVLSKELQQEKQRLFQKLFKSKPLKPFEYFQHDEIQHPDQKWDQTDYQDQLNYERIAVDNSPSYFYERPIDVRGIDLLKLETNIGVKHNLLKKWRSLSIQDQARLNEGSETVYNHRIRIWQGYEVVEYLKQNLEMYSNNPYLLLGLYPWEIIKDKLRNKRNILEFEYDYYDILIKEAFGRNSTRKPWHIFYTDYVNSHNTDINHDQMMKLYHSLPESERDYYSNKYKNRQLQTILQRSPINSIAFHNFYYKNFQNSNNRPLLNATIQWNSNQIDKNLYKPQNSDFGKSRIYREQLLDLKTQVVMDYIFYTGGSIGAPPNFNWLTNMKSVVGNLHYLKRIYTTKIV